MVCSHGKDLLQARSYQPDIANQNKVYSILLTKICIPYWRRFEIIYKILCAWNSFPINYFFPISINMYGGREGPSRKKFQNQEKNIHNQEINFRNEKWISESRNKYSQSRKNFGIEK